MGMTVNSEEGGKYLLVGALNGVRYLTVWCFGVFPSSLRHRISVRPSKRFILDFIGRRKTPKLHSDTRRGKLRSELGASLNQIALQYEEEHRHSLVVDWTFILLG